MTSQSPPGIKVPLVDLQAQYQPLRSELLAAMTRVCDSQRFILGPEIEALEAELARMLEAEHAITVSSGTDALLAVMMALGIGSGDEVITSTYSFFATAGCIARLGARPVLVDIDPATFNIDPAAVEGVITGRTRALVPVHLFGLSADLDPLMHVAGKAGIPVIEDACQAIGAQYRGRTLGTIGAAGCFSFFPSKNLGAFGDGGLVVTNDDQLARTVRLLRDHGSERKYFHALIGGNFRLDALQAAVLRVKASHVQVWTEARRQNADRYRRLFLQSGLDSRIVLPIEPSGRRHVYHQYIVRVPERDALRSALEARGIGTGLYYPVPFHLQVCFGALGYRAGQFPHAESAARESLALPMYAELTEDQQAYVVRSIAESLHAT